MSDQGDRKASKEGIRGGSLMTEAFYRDRNVADEEQGPGDKAKTILRKILICLVPLFALVWAVDAAVQYCLPEKKLLPYMQKELAFYTMKVDHFRELPLPDVVIIGSSRTRNGVNAALLSEELSSYWGRPARAFNLGLDGAMIAEFASLLSSQMPDPAPPHVVICLSGQEMVQFKNFFYAPRFLWTAPDLIDYLSHVTFEEFSAESVEYYIESVICRFWYIFKHRDALKELLRERAGMLLGFAGCEDDFNNRQAPDRLKNLNNLILSEHGYEAEESQGMNLEERLNKNPKSLPRITQKRLDKDAALFEKKNLIAPLRKAVESARSNGSRVVLAECPPSPYDQKQRSVLSGEGFRSWMQGVADDLGVTFIAFPPEETLLTNDLYEDASHLSPEGADSYTRVLFKRLRDSGFLD